MSKTSRWISVGELAEAFSPRSNTPAPTEDLVGETVELHLESGQTVAHRFEAGCRLFWEITSGRRQTGAAERAAEENCFTAKVREGIYFVDFIKHLEQATTVTLILDLNAAITTVLVARLPDESEPRWSLAERIVRGQELTAVSATFLRGSIGSPFGRGTPRHEPTTDLVGRRVEYTYSPTERYEHIYLNEDFYTWHCLSGSEKGLADTDRCHCYKLADNLYFFVWREKIVPTLGAVVVDFDQMRTVGKIFGYREAGTVESPKLSNFPVGAHARLLNVTTGD